MASMCTEHRRLQRRDSSPTALSRTRNHNRRPQLLRAGATEPSVTTSSASKGVLASPNSTRRAADILTRVAVSNATSDTILRSSPSSTRSFVMDGSDRADSLQEEFPRHEKAYSDGYFSFPSFDAWEEEQTEEDKSYEGPS